MNAWTRPKQFKMLTSLLFLVEGGVTHKAGQNLLLRHHILEPTNIPITHTHLHSCISYLKFSQFSLHLVYGVLLGCSRVCCMCIATFNAKHLDWWLRNKTTLLINPTSFQLCTQYLPFLFPRWQLLRSLYSSPERVTKYLIHHRVGRSPLQELTYQLEASSRPNSP